MPRSVAVVGATERMGSVGRAVMANLADFDGPVLPINCRHASVLGKRSYARVGDLPEVPDLVIIATPAPTVPGIVRDCVGAAVKAAVVLTAGFRECGPAGERLEREVLAAAREGGLRLIGPNCLGLMIPHRQLNATFAAGLARPGNIAFLSQSGALCTAVLDWSRREYFGLSAMVSVGSMADVGWDELITALGDEPHTRSILIYMESIGDARSFLSAAREVAFTKPIIVVKAGRTEVGSRTAVSHTGALTGADAVVDAAFRRVGVLRVEAIEDLFDMAELLGKQPRAQGPRLAIVTNAGGPAALAMDALVLGGGRAAELSAATITQLDQLLPPHWSHGNPVDVLGDANEDRYARAVELVANDPAVDATLVVLTPQAMTDPAVVAGKLVRLATPGGKPLFASWMGADAVEAGEAVLNAAGIPTFKFPDRAAQAFNYMWRYGETLAALYETPSLADPEYTGGRACAESVLQTVRKQGRTLLTESESKAILAAYSIPVAAVWVAETEEQTAALAAQIGFPVAVKLLSQTITHKAEVGGVYLDVQDVAQAREAWRSIRRAVLEKKGAQHFLGVSVQRMVASGGVELLLGSSTDAQFGPVVVFGAGGRLVEVWQDRAIALPPLNRTLARRLMEETKIHAALAGTRGLSARTLSDLENILVRFSQLVAELSWVKEIDVNPLLVSDTEIVGLDARIVLHEPPITAGELPRLAIRPYPRNYISECTLADGTPIVLRPIRPDDEPLMVRFHGALSEQSVYFRYFTHLPLAQRTRHAGLSRLCFVDYDREIAMVAVRQTVEGSEILGVGRLCRKPGAKEAEFALVVADLWQRHGLGTFLLGKLVRVAEDEGLARLAGVILAENIAMRRLCEKLGFRVQCMAGQPEFEASLLL